MLTLKKAFVVPTNVLQPFLTARRKLRAFVHTKMRKENGEDVLIGIHKWNKLKQPQLQFNKTKLAYNDHCKKCGLTPKRMGKHGTPPHLLSDKQRRKLTKSITGLTEGIQVFSHATSLWHPAHLNYTQSSFFEKIGCESLKRRRLGSEPLGVPL